jgi:hypothetical protein
MLVVLLLLLAGCCCCCCCCAAACCCVVVLLLWRRLLLSRAFVRQRAVVVVAFALEQRRRDSRSASGRIERHSVGIIVGSVSATFVIGSGVGDFAGGRRANQNDVGGRDAEIVRSQLTSIARLARASVRIRCSCASSTARSCGGCVGTHRIREVKKRKKRRTRSLGNGMGGGAVLFLRDESRRQ